MVFKRKTIGCDFQDQGQIRSMSEFQPDTVTERVDCLLQLLCLKLVTTKEAIDLYWMIPVQTKEKAE